MLKSIRVQNFRLFGDLEIDPLKRINLFTGQNNSGKTTLLEALFLLFGAGNPGLTLNINAFRGIDSAGGSPPTIQETLWKYLFSTLEMSEVITIEADHTSLGRLALRVELERPSTVEVPLDKSDGASMAELMNESPLLFSFQSKRGGHGKYRMSLTGGRIKIDQPTVRFPFQAIFLSSRSGNLQEDAVRLAQLRKRKRADILLKTLKIIEPRLRSVEDNSASGTPMIWGDIGMSELVPLPVMGEGMTRVARLMLSIATVPGGLVLADEVENGLHHSILPKVWQAVGAAAKNFDTQVFATTHSYECMDAAYQALGKDGFRLHRLEAGEGKSRCVTLEPDQVDAALRHDMEVR